MISLILTIAVLGFIAWAISLLPIPEPFGQIIRVVLIIAAVLAVVGFLLGTGPTLGFPIR